MFNYRIVQKKAWESMREELDAFKQDVAAATAFVKKIEEGDLNGTIANANVALELVQSLHSMRDQMKAMALKDQERRWTNEGLARFVEILRTERSNLEQLSYDIISGIVKYLNANQGGLYLVNDDDPNDVFLELHACYAYGKKKFITKRIQAGQGLIGQALLEKETAYITDVPKDFLKITSGLGEALPRNILIVPLKLDDNVLGIIELASFQALQKFEIAFVEKIGESIAATIWSLKGGERTAKLLEETQQQAEEMRAQEEEMRQNMEELAATQEEMQRILNEVQNRELFISNLINASKDSILAIDRDLKVITCNDVFKSTYKGMEIAQGFDIRKLFSTGSELSRYEALYGRAFNGEAFDVNDHYTFGDIDAYYIISYIPLRNTDGEVDAVAVFVKDVTELTVAKIKTEQSERIAKNLIDISGDSIVTIGRDYKIQLFNETYRKSFAGMGFEIRQGFDYISIFDADAAREKRKLFDRVFSGETVEVDDHLTLNGVDKYYLVTTAPLKDLNGDISSIAIFARDVTELTKVRLEAERLLRETQQQAEELRAQEAELRQNVNELHAQQEEMRKQLAFIATSEEMLNNREMAVGVTTILSEADLFGNIIYVNELLTKVSGYSAEELIGKPHNILRHPDMPKELFRKMWATIKSGEIFRGIVKNKKKDGSHYWVDAAIVPIKDKEGRIVKYIGARYHIADDELAMHLYQKQAGQFDGNVQI